MLRRSDTSNINIRGIRSIIKPENIQIPPTNMGLGCQGAPAWVDSFIKALMRSKELNFAKAILNFNNISKIVNDVCTSLEDITYNAKYYFLENDHIITDFIKSCDNLCSTIHKYSDSILKDSEDDIVGEDILERHYVTILYRYEKDFKILYSRAKALIDDREKFEKPVHTKSEWIDKIKTILGGSAVLTLTKLWELKIYIYITGVLLYNISIYVFPTPVTTMLNQCIRLFGVICYAVSTDAILFYSTVQVINNIIMKLSTLLFGILGPFLIKIIDSNIVQNVNAFFSYIFTFYCFGWMSKIAVGVCKTLTILKPLWEASKDTGNSTATYIIEASKQLGSDTHEFALNAGTYIISLVVQSAPAIIEGLIMFFSNYAMSTTSSIYNYLSSGFKGSIDGLIRKVLNMWKASSKEISLYGNENKQIQIDSVDEPLMIIDKKNQLIATKIIELFLENNDLRSAEETDNPSKFVETNNPLFKMAISNDSDKEGYFLDRQQLHRNLQNIAPFKVSEIIEEGLNATQATIMSKFTEFFHDAVASGGLTDIVAAMTYSSSIKNPNVPSIILLQLLGAEKIYTYMVQHRATYTQKVILSIILICTILLSITFS